MEIIQNGSDYPQGNEGDWAACYYRDETAWVFIWPLWRCGLGEPGTTAFDPKRPVLFALNGSDNPSRVSSPARAPAN